MSLVYLPVEPRDGLTSAIRADKIDKEIWRIQRPLSVQSDGDTKCMYATVVHPTTGQVAILADTSDVLSVHPDTDLTNLLELLTEVPQSEKDALVSYINANLGGTVLFSNLIPSTSTQLTKDEASDDGWLPNNDTP